MEARWRTLPTNVLPTWVTTLDGMSLRQCTISYRTCCCFSTRRADNVGSALQYPPPARRDVGAITHKARQPAAAARLHPQRRRHLSTAAFHGVRVAGVPVWSRVAGVPIPCVPTRNCRASRSPRLAAAAAQTRVPTLTPTSARACSTNIRELSSILRQAVRAALHGRRLLQPLRLLLRGRGPTHGPAKLVEAALEHYRTRWQPSAAPSSKQTASMRRWPSLVG
jgi:hypothetical protein